VMTAVMLACYLLWTRADLLLFTGPPFRGSKTTCHQIP